MPSSACKTCALRSEEHTSELQSHSHLVCPLLLEKKNGRVGVLVWLIGFGLGLAMAPATEAVMGSLLCFFFKDTATTEISTLSLHGALPINDTATTEIYTLSLHDALPISVVAVS